MPKKTKPKPKPKTKAKPKAQAKAKSKADKLKCPVCPPCPKCEPCPVKKPGKIKCVLISILLIIALLGSIFFFIYTLLPAKAYNPEPKWGVTYVPRFAENLNLDWQKTFTSILDDLNFKYFRLAAYWDEIEPINNQYDFKDLDWLINEVEKRNGHIVLAIGRKNLRWPECYEPDWTQDLMYEQKEQELLEMVSTVVNRYKDRKVIYMWQVENEAFFPFGLCPKPSPEVFKAEIDLVKSLDNRPVMVTDSGELSTWRKVTKYGDILGITMYRDVSNPLLGDFHWPNPPAWYSKRAWFAEKRVDEVIIAEFQMEPWYNVPFTSIPVQEQYSKFDAISFDENIEYAKESGFSTFYIWGVEWWYYMKKHNFPILWEKAKLNFNNK